jgi:hypothetical protein
MPLQVCGQHLVVHNRDRLLDAGSLRIAEPNFLL